MAEIARLDVIIGGNADSLNKALRDAKGQLISFEQTTKAAGQLQPFSKATSGALAAARSVQQLNDVLAQLKIEQAGVTNSKELLAYNNAIKATTLQIKALNTATAEGGASGAKGLNKTYGAIRQIANILPGIGIAGIFGLAFEAISQVVEEMHLFGKATEDAAKNAADLNKELSKQGADLNTELTTLSALVQVARDHGESLQARKAAIDQINKLYPGYLGNINLENINSQEAANAIIRLSEALQRKALAQAYSNLLTKASEELLTKQGESIADNITLFDKVAAAFKNAGTFNKGFVSDIVTSGVKNQADSIKQLQGVVDSYSHTLADLTQEQARNNDFKLLDPTAPAKLKKQKTAIDEYAESLKALNKALRYPHHIVGDVAPKQPFEPVKIAENFLSLSEIDAKNALIKMRDTLRLAGKQVFSSQGILSDVSLLNDAEVKENFDKWKSGLLEVVGVVDSLGTAFEQVFTTLISGGTHAFKALAGALTALIAKLIAAVIEAAILSAILTAVTGGSSLITGGAGFGNILKQLIGGGLQFAHADGGIFTQPTRWGNHLMGEKGPEALIPLDRLAGMMQGAGGQRIEIYGRLQGRDIVLSSNRTNTANSRTYGSNYNKPN